MQQGDTTLAALQDDRQQGRTRSSTRCRAGKGTIGKLLVDETLYNKRRWPSRTESQKLIGDAQFRIRARSAKLMNDDELYDDVRGTVARVNNLMDGIDRAGNGRASS